MDNLGEARLPFVRTAVLPRWPLVMTSVLMPRSGHAVDGDAARPPLREVRGVVERITYQNPDNGYTVARLAPEQTAAAGQPGVQRAQWAVERGRSGFMRLRLQMAQDQRQPILLRQGQQFLVQDTV